MSAAAASKLQTRADLTDGDYSNAGVLSSILPMPLGTDGTEEERPYPCLMCDARFKKKQHLQNHERIHTGQKFVCEVCEQAFSRKNILKQHVIRKHPEVLKMESRSSVDEAYEHHSLPPQSCAQSGGDLAPTQFADHTLALLYRGMQSP